jgi:glycerophosphoryl diester phosphodiesterase
VVSSFSGAALAAARRVAPNLPYALLTAGLPDDWREQTQRLGAVALHADARLLGDAALAAVQAAGVKLACYTVNERAAADSLLARGVTVFTDRPDLWRPGEM